MTSRIRNSIDDATPEEWDSLRRGAIGSPQGRKSAEELVKVPEAAKSASALARQVGGGHYKEMAIQPVEYIVANELSWCEGNIVKYITRHKQKGGRQDVEKVIHYAQLLLDMEYKGDGE